jgi:hypothetical protein
MPIIVNNDQICLVKLELDPAEVTWLLERHSTHYPGAEECERLGASAALTGFAEHKAVQFVQAVVTWGGGHRFLGRLLEQNPRNEISLALRDAHALLLDCQSSAAVMRLQQLRYLGQSFASKVARFLMPDRAVILDEVIRGALGYRESQDGYQEFLDDCQSIHDHLVVSMPNLRICDVEAAIFAKIQGY